MEPAAATKTCCSNWQIYLNEDHRQAVISLSFQELPQGLLPKEELLPNIFPANTNKHVFSLSGHEKNYWLPKELQYSFILIST